MTQARSSELAAGQSTGVGATEPSDPAGAAQPSTPTGRPPETVGRPSDTAGQTESSDATAVRGDAASPGSVAAPAASMSPGGAASAPGTGGPADERWGAVREPRRDEALPGELRPLRWHPQRGPITDEEALGVMRRRRRVDLAGAPKSRGKRSPVPTELPDPTAPRQPTMFRLPPLLVARVHARAELEDVPLTTIVEELLSEYAAGTPEHPDEVARRLEGRGIRRQRR